MKVQMVRAMYDASLQYRMVKPEMVEGAKSCGWQVVEEKPAKSAQQSYSELLAAVARGQNVSPVVLERWRLKAAA